MRHIYLCECILSIFIAWTYSSHPWPWPAYVKSWFAFIRTIEIKGLCLQLKRSGTTYTAQKTNFYHKQLQKAVHFLSEKFRSVLTRYWLAFYFFFYPINMSSTWRDKFYWFWLISIEFLTTFWSETTHLETVITPELEERDKETVNGDFSDFCCSFKFSNMKKAFHLYFKCFNASVNFKRQYSTQADPWEIYFKVVNFPFSGQRICAELRPRGKNYRQKHRPWGQPCGPLRQFFHNCEFAFFVVIFNPAFFEFFFKDHKACEWKTSQ